MNSRRNTIYPPPENSAVKKSPAGNFWRRAPGLLFLLLLPVRLAALDLPDWTGGFFFDLEGHYYIIPDFTGTLDVSLAEQYSASGGLIKPRPSFRAGAGYEWRKIRFSLESGSTWIDGNNPLILDIHLVPLTFKLGYAFSFFNRLTLVPLLGAGPVFASVNHYETALAVLMNKPSYLSFTGFMAATGLRLGWSFMPALNLYAGAGIDWILEISGPIPLPAVELGISFKPFLLGKRFRPRTPRPVPEPPVEPVSKPEPVPEPVEIIPVEVPVPEPAVETAEILPVEPEVEPEPPVPEPVPEPEPPARIFRVLRFPVNAEVSAPFRLVKLDSAGTPPGTSPNPDLSFRGYLRREYDSAGGGITVE